MLASSSAMSLNKTKPGGCLTTPVCYSELFACAILTLNEMKRKNLIPLRLILSEVEGINSAKNDISKRSRYHRPGKRGYNKHRERRKRAKA